MTKAGEKQIKDLKLSSEEITAMQMALDGSLDKEHNKRGKITKPVLCSLLQKIIPETKWFEQQVDHFSFAIMQPANTVRKVIRIYYNQILS